MLNGLLIAFATYSKIPVPQADWNDRRYAMCFFPLVGAAVALVLGAWLMLCDALHFGAMLRGAVGAAIPLLVTGGIHMDGFMDTSDALASWQPKEKRLEILKDSHVGAFAVIGCAAYLLTMAGLMSELHGKDVWALGACLVLSRALSAWAMTWMKSARPGGMLDGFAKTAQNRAIAVSTVLYGSLCTGVLFAAMGAAALLPLAAAALSVVHYKRMAYKQFGGVTGDLAGYFVQTTEWLCILAVLVGGRL